MAAIEARLAFQESPERPGFPAFDADLVSPELPCGASWLASALLELGVALWKPWGIQDLALWKPLGGRRYEYRCPGSPWSRLVPGWRDGRELEFRAAPVPRCSHAWPELFLPTPRTILFVRDPRDMLYSAWRRAGRFGEIAPELDFVRFAGAPYHHYPLTWAEYSFVFLRAWRAALVDRPHIVLRFEDAKADPIGTLRRALDFLALRAPASEIRRACEASDHGEVLRAERRLVAEGVVPTSVLGGGVPYEYRQHFTEAMHAVFSPRFEDVCAWLGYEAIAGQARAPASPAGWVAEVDALAHAVTAGETLAAPRLARLRRCLVAAVDDGGPASR